MAIFLLALLIGVVAGLRAMLVPAVLSLAAHLGVIDLEGTWLSFLERGFAPWLFGGLALLELVTDQLPSTPARTVPIQFATRVLIGALSGSAVALVADQSSFVGALAGAIGAVLGTIGGHAARARLAERFGRDRPAAFLEDAVAIAGALLIVWVLP
jgi:uncharacterized membrane protein